MDFLNKRNGAIALGALGIAALLYLQNSISSEQTRAALIQDPQHNYTVPDIGGIQKFTLHGPGPTTEQLGVSLYAIAGICIVAAVGVLIIYLWILRRHRIHT